MTSEKMNILPAAYFLLCVVSLNGDEMQIVPAHPPLTEFGEQADDAAIVLTCEPNAAKDSSEVSVVGEGHKDYEIIKNEISDCLGASDKEAPAANGFREVVFINSRADQPGSRLAYTNAWWPQGGDVLANGQNIRFLSLMKEDIESIVQEQQKKPKSEQATPRKPSDPFPHMLAQGKRIKNS